MPDWLIPLLIFSARIVDVSIGTIRMIMVIAGHRIASALLGFVEVAVWVLAVAGALKHLERQPLAIVGYAGGFAVGTLVGMTIENHIALGFRVIRVINPRPALDLAGELRGSGFTATRIDGHDRHGPVEIVFIPARRRSVPSILDRIAAIVPDAFVSVERAERISGFAGAGATAPGSRLPWRRFSQIRK